METEVISLIFDSELRERKVLMLHKSEKSKTLLVLKRVFSEEALEVTLVASTASILLKTGQL